MLNQLQQSAANAVNHPASAWSVVLGSVGSGISTFLEVLPPTLGIVATCAGIVLSILLARKHIAERELMIAETQLAKKEVELRDAQIRAIDDRQHPRGE